MFYSCLKFLKKLKYVYQYFFSVGRCFRFFKLGGGVVGVVVGVVLFFVLFVTILFNGTFLFNFLYNPNYFLCIT